jgi:hypothetical protein
VPDAGPGRALDEETDAVHARDLDVAHVATGGDDGAPAAEQDRPRPLDRAHDAEDVAVVVPASAEVRTVEHPGEAVEGVGAAVLALARVMQVGEGEAAEVEVVRVPRAAGASGTVGAKPRRQCGLQRRSGCGLVLLVPREERRGEEAATRVGDGRWGR